jgi:hypothetical protein
LNHYFHGEDPFFYHLTNLFIHSMNSLLLFFFFFLLYQHAEGALFCALIFAIHPIHTEAVNGIVGRGELLTFLFFSSL